MLRRLGIAQALLNDPRLLIVGEPIAGLDVAERLKFREFLLDLPPDRLTVLSTHLVEDVEAVCDTVVVMVRGALLFQGTKRKLLRRFAGRVFEVPREAVPAEAGVSIAVRRAQGSPLSRIYLPPGQSPPPEAQAVAATLQDAYLILVHGDRAISVA